MKKLLFALLLAVYPALATGQQSVQQSGNVTPGHVPTWVTNGIIGDGGTPTQGALSGLGITASGPSFCIESDVPTAAGWQQFCFGVTTAGGAQISVQNFGTAVGQGISYLINGSAATGQMFVTLPTTANDSACFSNTTGTLADCGFPAGNVVGPASSVNNHIAVFNGTTGRLLADGGTIGATTLTGDITGGPSVGTVATTLATVNANVGSFGSATQCLQVTVNGKGLVTAASVTTCTPAFSSLTGTASLGQLPTIPLTQLATQGNNTVLGNNSGGNAIPSALSPSAVLDIFGSSQGDILYRDAAAWLALTPGSAGQLLTSNGPGANPAWTTAVGTGSVTNVSTGNGLTGGPITTTGTVSVDVSYVPGFIGGLVMSNDVNTPNTVIDSAAGAVASDDSTYFMKAGAFTKNTNAAWAVGSATGCLDSGTGLVLSTWYHLYVIARTDTNVVDELCSMAPPNLSEAASAISNASPAVVTLAGHGLQIGQPVKFTTTGSLPTGLTVGTQYWIIAAGFTTGQFEVSATCSGTGCSTGTAVNTSGAGSGTHSVVTATILPTNYTKQRRIGSFKTDSSVHILAFKQTNDTFIFSAQIQEFGGAVVNPGTSAITRSLLGVPTGVVVEAALSWDEVNGSNNHYDLITPLSVADVAASATAFTLDASISSGNSHYGGQIRVLTNTSAQFRNRLSASGASDQFSANTVGWRDFRGQ